MLNKFLDTLKQKANLSWLFYAFLMIVSFNLTNNICVFATLAIALTYSFAFIQRKTIDKRIILLALSIIPLLSFGACSIVSAFNNDPDAGFSILKSIFLLVIFATVPFSGFLAKRNEKFSIKWALVCTYVLLALWMVVNLILTWCSYGFFHTIIYKNSYFFDYGRFGRLAIGDTAVILLGFRVERVDLQLFNLLSVILSSAILGVFFVDRKQNMRLFLTYLVCGIIGIIGIVFFPNMRTVLSILALVVIDILIVLFARKSLKFNKITKGIIIGIGSFIGVIIIIFILNSLVSVEALHPLQDAFTNSRFLNRLFNTNRFVNGYHRMIGVIATNRSFNGFTGYLLADDSLKFTGSFIFDLFALTGVLGFIVFAIFIGVFVYEIIQYFKSDNDSLSDKIVVLGYICAFFASIVVSYNSQPYYENSKYLPFYFFAPFIIVLFIYGYVGCQKEEATNEK